VKEDGAVVDSSEDPIEGDDVQMHEAPDLLPFSKPYASISWSPGPRWIDPFSTL